MAQDNNLDVMTQLTGAIAQQTEVLAGMKSALENKNHLEAAEKQAAFPTYTRLHGVGGIFAVPGMERDVISAYVRPYGIGSALPFMPSIVEDPRFGSLTGYTATTPATNPNYPCDDAPAGYVKSCTLTAQFGRVMYDSQTIEYNKLMMIRNRGDFTDLVLRGRVLGLANLAPASLNEADILKYVTKSEMVIMGVNLERILSRHMWQGNPANNTAGGGYMEFPGLDLQIATGQVDSVTGARCYALDSDVKNFAYNNVCGTTPSIVDYLSMLEYYLRHNAMTMGLEPATWAIVMRPELWWELSACWPCSFLSNRCQTGGANSNVALVINDETNVRMRDSMRTGAYIDIGGNRYPVITDTGIFEHNNVNNQNLLPGQYASSIYMVPLTITGGFPVVYREYVDYRAAQGEMAGIKATPPFWTDDGIYLWALETLNYCFTLKVKTEQRIILRTPQLAGRIDLVSYSPLQHLREAYPDSPYNADGGVSLRTEPNKYAVWLSRGVQ